MSLRKIIPICSFSLIASALGEDISHFSIEKLPMHDIISHVERLEIEYNMLADQMRSTVLSELRPELDNFLHAIANSFFYETFQESPLSANVFLLFIRCLEQVQANVEVVEYPASLLQQAQEAMVRITNQLDGVFVSANLFGSLNRMVCQYKSLYHRTKAENPVVRSMINYYHVVSDENYSQIAVRVEQFGQRLDLAHRLIPEITAVADKCYYELDEEDVPSEVGLLAEKIKANIPDVETAQDVLNLVKAEYLASLMLNNDDANRAFHFLNEFESSWCFCHVEDSAHAIFIKTIYAAMFKCIFDHLHCYVSGSFFHPYFVLLNAYAAKYPGIKDKIVKLDDFASIAGGLMMMLKDKHINEWGHAQFCAINEMDVGV